MEDESCAPGRWTSSRPLPASACLHGARDQLGAESMSTSGSHYLFQLPIPLISYNRARSHRSTVNLHLLYRVYFLWDVHVQRWPRSIVAWTEQRCVPQALPDGWPAWSSSASCEAWDHNAGGWPVGRKTGQTPAASEAATPLARKPTSSDEAVSSQTRFIIITILYSYKQYAFTYVILYILVLV